MVYSRVEADFVRDFIESLGAEWDRTREVVIRRGRITVTQLRQDELGRPYAAGDDVATETHDVAVGDEWGR